MGFEVYKKNDIGSAIQGMTVSIRVASAMVLSKELYAAMGKPKRIEFLWDAETRTAAMRASVSENSYVVSERVRSVHIKGFARHYGITLTDRHAPVGRAGDLWVFQPEADGAQS